LTNEVVLDALRGFGFKACEEGRIVRFLIKDSFSMAHSFLIFQKIIFNPNTIIYLFLSYYLKILNYEKVNFVFSIFYSHYHDGICSER